ncbi:polysaccharide biosynthesis C-terminal domain-containing protein [Candidatus Saccharibacteria bacterium]|nr:polysaccharide biosynthesis C-terminal domain-containing protein [Candidatus Saccharibacteria bacterium]MBH1973366.1 polysaccharide biosynthesis C-terminal domain-containing protein [Candidatus Saccharibacteria bacterium]MBH1990393.1 polysaccharide biosynthesis C-terminal domain-containing protein [Candidatus Saccharibacteria bacterium]OGL24230.1 MAG: virulence factor MviN [Candidatus Saccharibacteria bacterium RIFCSPHIGHO2_01_FULL_46_30]
MRTAVARANKRVTIQLAATLLAGSTLASLLFGFFRMRLLNAAYYDTYPTGYDAYIAAFTVPDFMFFILVSGALSVTFIPVFNQRLGTGNKKSAWELSTSMINFMALITLVASILMIIFAEPLIRYVIAPGLDESGIALATSMMRVIAINPFLFAIATVIASIQQAVGRFTFFALAPILYNIGIIIGLTVFTNGITIFGWQVFEGGIMGVALGVVLGSILQLIVSSIGLLGLGFDYQFKIFWKNKGFRKVLTLLPARSLDQGMDYLVGIVETNLASRLGAGTLAAYNNATTLHMAPINLIGVAISTAAFPKMTERLSQGRPDLFKSELQSILRVIIWLAMPVAAITFFTRGYLVNFIKNGGDALMAGLLGSLVVAILFRSIYYIAARSFYAQQDTKTPLYISIVAISLNIGLAIWFTMELNMGAYGLGFAQSIVAVVEVLILFTVMNRRIPGLFDGALLRAFGRMTIATVIMSVVTYGTLQFFQLQNDDQSFLATFPKFVAISLISAGVYLLVSRYLKLTEADPVLRRLRSLLFGRTK